MLSHEQTDPFASLEEAAHRQDAQEKAATVIRMARSRLVLSKDACSTFFAALALRLETQPAWDVLTLATDGERLLFNPEYVLAFSEREVGGVVAHEVMHCALGHHGRGACATRCAGTSFAIWRSIPCFWGLDLTCREGVCSLARESSPAGQQGSRQRSIMPVCLTMGGSPLANRTRMKVRTVPETMAGPAEDLAKIQALAGPSKMPETAAQPCNKRARHAGKLQSPRPPA